MIPFRFGTNCRLTVNFLRVLDVLWDLDAERFGEASFKSDLMLVEEPGGGRGGFCEDASPG